MIGYRCKRGATYQSDMSDDRLGGALTSPLSRGGGRRGRAGRRRPFQEFFFDSYRPFQVPCVLSLEYSENRQQGPGGAGLQGSTAEAKDEAKLGFSRRQKHKEFDPRHTQRSPETVTAGGQPKNVGGQSTSGRRRWRLAVPRQTTSAAGAERLARKGMGEQQKPAADWRR